MKSLFSTARLPKPNPQNPIHRDVLSAPYRPNTDSQDVRV